MCLVPSQTILSTDETGSIAPPIFTSVGQDAVNGPGDVFVIQSLLNRRLPQPHVDIPVSGAIDPGTILAIKTFQAVAMNMNPPSGHVAPASPTYYALAARPLVSKRPPPQIRFGHVGILPPEVIEAARASQTRWGIPASVTLAQWIVESAWGSAMPPDSNNPFGIKALELAAGGGKRNPRSGRRQGGDHHRPVPALRQPGRSLRSSRQAAGDGSPLSDRQDLSSRIPIALPTRSPASMRPIRNMARRSSG